MENEKSSCHYKIFYALFQMQGRSCYTVFHIPLATLLLKKNILWYIWFLISLPQTVRERNFLRMWKGAGFSFENTSTAAEGSPTPKAPPAVITHWNRCLWDSPPRSLQCTRLFCLWYQFPVLNYIYHLSASRSIK